VPAIDALPLPVITLLTDFGLADTYVGQMKGVVLSINPRAVIVDLTHDVRPQQIRQGAFLLETAIGAFPPGTIHVAVVDPGVGTERRALAVETDRGWLVGPDNGVLSAALPEAMRPAGDEPALVPLPAGVRAVELADPRFRRAPVSATFHGRDIYAPAAAHLSLGVPLDDLGPAVDRLIALPPFRARRDASGRLRARVVSIDHFGNVITDCRAADLPAGRFIARIHGQPAPGPVRTYGAASGPAALVGSGGYLEIAVPGGNAAARFDAAIGDEIVVEPERGNQNTARYR
jgi:S-adenosylmethionine hydrolase